MKPPNSTQFDTNTRARAAQRRFLAAYKEIGMVTEAARAAGLHRTTHYTWLKDPVYRDLFRTAEIQATQRLIDEAVRMARDGVVRMVLYKGEPVNYRGKPVVEHLYSDRLMIKLLEAKDQDQFNRQKVSPFEGDLDNLTEEQVRSLIAWLEEKVLTAEAMEVLYDSERRQAVEVAEVTVPATSAPEAEKAELVSPIRFVSPFRGADGWPYKVERKKRK